MSKKSVSTLRRSRPTSTVRAIALGCTILSAAALPAHGRAADLPTITVAEPVGFADLTQDRTMLIDIYFGGARRGETMVAVTPEAIKFLDAEALLALLPSLADRDVVEAALAGQSLPGNSDLVCTPGSDRTRCGRLSPETVGVIFDRDRFRIELFLNPRLLAVQDAIEDRYLPRPEGGLSMINAIGGVLSGRLGDGDEFYNLQDQLVIASGERRVRADLSYSSELAFGVERLAFELDRPERRYSAGALWAPGNDILGRRKLLGLGVETQIDTRQDKDEILGSPVIVFLDRRARVDVVRQGRVLNSAIYEAGNQQIDTSNLPEGSYEIILRVEQVGQPPREEKRFYTKSRRIPSVGRTDFFAYGGLLVDSPSSGSLAPSSRPYFQGGISRRLGEDWALDGTVLATERDASAEVGTTILTSFAQLRAAAVADTTGTYGTILLLSSSGASRLNFNLDLRRLEGGEKGEEQFIPPSVSGFPAGDPFDLSATIHGKTGYSQVGGIVSYSLADVRFLGTFFYRDDGDENSHYSIGPSLEWDILRKGPFKVTLLGELTLTERGNSGFAGISVRLLGGNSSLMALAGGRSSNVSDDDLADGPVTAVSGAWSTKAAGGELAVGAGFEHQPRQDDVVLSSEFRNRFGALSGDFVRSDSDSSAVSQYSVGFQTSFAAGAGGVRVAGKTTTESMIVAAVIGARENDRFDILVDEQVVGSIVGERALTLALPAYRAYDVRIRPTGEDLLAYDSSVRKVGLYPGVVTKLDWAAAPVVIKFGRLVDPTGSPIRGASITGKGIWSETDDAGYFQIEVPVNAELQVTLLDGRTFAVTLPEGNAKAGIARIGRVVCCGSTEFKFGALDPLPRTTPGESQ